jgi:uncharacterized phage infection (PIP) family protein YhgE
MSISTKNSPADRLRTLVSEAVSNPVHCGQLHSAIDSLKAYPGNAYHLNQTLARVRGELNRLRVWNDDFQSLYDELAPPNQEQKSQLSKGTSEKPQSELPSLSELAADIRSTLGQLRLQPMSQATLESLILEVLKNLEALSEQLSRNQILQDFEGLDRALNSGSIPIPASEKEKIHTLMEALGTVLLALFDIRMEEGTAISPKSVGDQLRNPPSRRRAYVPIPA